MERTTLQVADMACDGCERNVIEAVEALDGVVEATANHETGEVRVEHEGTLIDREALGGTVEDAGYRVVG